MALLLAPVAARAAAPANTTPPAIGGSAREGQTLTRDPGTWSGATPITYTQRWQRCDATGAECVTLPSTGATYPLLAADVGSTLRVVVTATNADGVATATSAATAVVTGTVPTNTAAPTVAGNARQGQVLTAGKGTWSGTLPQAYAYEWRRCDAAGQRLRADRRSDRGDVHAGRRRRRLDDPAARHRHQRRRHGLGDLGGVRRRRPARAAGQHGPARDHRHYARRVDADREHRHLDRRRHRHLHPPLAALQRPRDELPGHDVHRGDLRPDGGRHRLDPAPRRHGDQPGRHRDRHQRGHRRGHRQPAGEHRRAGRDGRRPGRARRSPRRPARGRARPP